MVMKRVDFIGELCRATEEYHGKWHAFVKARDDKAFFEALKPTAAAWKVLNRVELDDRLAALRDQSDYLHFAWVNERWLVTVVLKEACLPGTIKVVKLMERRLGSTDPIGLDHIDFLLPKGDAKEVLGKEHDLKWTEERNGDHCQWLSLWFSGTEAKLRSDTVLQACADDLLSCQTQIVG